MNGAEKRIFIGTAGWTIPSFLKTCFEGEGTHLERYARQFNAVEINSSFYRDHKYETYVRWANSVPEDFRFAVKLSRYFTQQQRLLDSGPQLQDVLKGISGLGQKWGILLVQLPPSLDFDLKVAEKFIVDLRQLYRGAIVWEPRHISWSTASALQLLSTYQIDKVMADPEPCPVKNSRDTMSHVRYIRLHGTPEIYKSRYDQTTIHSIANSMSSDDLESWCIFDNTTYGFATENALELKQVSAL